MLKTCLRTSHPVQLSSSDILKLKNVMIQCRALTFSASVQSYSILTHLGPKTRSFWCMGRAVETGTVAWKHQCDSEGKLAIYDADPNAGWQRNIFATWTDLCVYMSMWNVDRGVRVRVRRKWFQILGNGCASMVISRWLGRSLLRGRHCSHPHPPLHKRTG